MKVIITGALGHMGKILTQKVREAEDMEIYALVDAASLKNLPSEGVSDPLHVDLSAVPAGGDIIIDFSNAAVTQSLIEYGVANKIPLLIATTGQTEEQRTLIEEASKKIPIFYSGNMSLGVALLVDLVRKAVSTFPKADIEIVETHHTRKVDAPSGTALMLADSAKDVRPELKINTGRSGESKREDVEIGIHSIRRGNVVGIHEVIISTDSQSITLKHEAHDRALFADGALDAARFLMKKKPGLYDMESLVAEKK